MKAEIKAYNEKQLPADEEICNLLATAINKELPDAENKIWHAHPVWFLEGNKMAQFDNGSIKQLANVLIC